ncbi:MAG: hypothetical protein H0U75_09580 [Legionella sp.]|nr:hypothetical protein [Legionella sp.]
MNTVKLINSLLRPVVNFSNFYQEYRVNAKKIKNVRYKIISTLEDYKKSNLIQLAFNDNPGDLLAPLSIEKIKKTPDIIAGMHPMDINSINDLYYIINDKIIEMRVENEVVIAINEDGTSTSYNIAGYIDPDTLNSTRLSYMIGHMQAEKLLRDSFSSILTKKDSYKIIADNITTLEIKHVNSNDNFLKHPLDILYSGEYKKFSSEDICQGYRACALK